MTGETATIPDSDMWPLDETPGMSMDTGREGGVTVIKVAAYQPDDDPDAEECDVWIDTAENPPQVYVRREAEGQEPTWSTSTDLNDQGKVAVIEDETMVIMRVIRSRAFSEVINNLMRAKKSQDLTGRTREVLDSLEDARAREICLLAGFDPEQWKPTQTTGAGGDGKRAIDLG